MRHFVDDHILVMLYYSLIYPFFTYGVYVWGLTFPTYLTQLFITQKKAIRISFSEPKSYSEPLFKSLNLLKLNDVIELQVLSFVNQWSCGLLPPPPLILVNISNLLILFILTQRGNRVKEIFMWPQLILPNMAHWPSALKLLAHK